jgi:GNAT superfamily N-acetyltransferase
MWKIKILEDGKEKELDGSFSTEEEANSYGEAVGFEAFKVTEVVDKLLKELEDNLCTDWLNASDSSVGIYPVSDIKDWANTEVSELEGIALISATSDNVVIECENRLFEIYPVVVKVDEEDYDYYWGIRVFSEAPLDIKMSSTKEGLHIYAVVDNALAQVDAMFVDVSYYGIAGLYVNRLIVAEKIRGRGIATALMNKLIAEADILGVNILLEINAYGDLTTEQLIVFYKEFGFIEKELKGLFVREFTVRSFRHNSLIEN